MATRTLTAGFLIAGLTLSLAGCASDATQPSGGPSAGNTFISVVGTPLLIALKIPFCAASIAIAAPLAGAAAMTPDGRDTEQALGAGLASNCGPPYVVNP
jgi:hypothetical protein